MAAHHTFTIARDKFNGITIDTRKYYTTDDQFGMTLKSSMARWRLDGVRGLWVKVAKQHASVIPMCVQEGFEFHHAHPNYVMMTSWLPTDEENMLPKYANQYLGCAGFVVNAQNQVLLVKEKYFKAGQHKWKLPGGLAEAGEDLEEISRREVLEETGVEADFECVLSFRHHHHYRHGCSDLYFVCLMRARSIDIKPCPEEIAESCWMDVNDYLNHPDISNLNRHIAQTYAEYTTRQLGSVQPVPVLSDNHKVSHLFYSVQPLSDSISHTGKSREGTAV